MIIINYNYLCLESAPADEDCKQVGIDSPLEQKEEAIRFRRGLESFYKEKVDQLPDGDVFFTIKRGFHDFGSYWDVIVKYNEENEDAEQLAIEIESTCPLTWAELEGGK